MTAADIVDFVYNGSNLVPALTLTHGFTLLGTQSIPVSFTSGALNIDLDGLNSSSTAEWQFFSTTGGAWALCSNGCSDMGTSGTWSTSNSNAATPEPASLALFGGAVAASAIRRRLLAR